jgi:hypothetical protein
MSYKDVQRIGDCRGKTWQNSLDRIKENMEDRLMIGFKGMDGWTSPSLSLRPICHPVMPKVFPAELT